MHRIARASAVAWRCGRRAACGGTLPEWLRVPVPVGKAYSAMGKQLDGLQLNTVCREARCPNIGECWGGGTATIMIMGRECTRACRFCSVATSRTPAPLDPDEPARVASAIAEWRDVRYVVITTVDRDDLADGGANHFAQTVRAVRAAAPSVRVEVLSGDFSGKREPLAALLESSPSVFAHNLETVERLTPAVRDRRAAYGQSLRVLSAARELAPSVPTKSALMLGFGETDDEVRTAMRDLRTCGVLALTIGQYARPTRRHMPVAEYVAPERFDALRDYGERELGFAYVAAGPLVRSSYRAGQYYEKLIPHIRSHSASAAN